MALDAMDRWKDLTEQRKRLVLPPCQCCTVTKLAPWVAILKYLTKRRKLGELRYKKHMKQLRHPSNRCCMVGYSTHKMVYAHPMCDPLRVSLNIAQTKKPQSLNRYELRAFQRSSWRTTPFSITAASTLVAISY